MRVIPSPEGGRNFFLAHTCTARPGWRVRTRLGGLGNPWLLYNLPCKHPLWQNSKPTTS